MNLYEVTIERKHIRGLQLKEETFLVIDESSLKAGGSVQVYFGTGVTVKNVRSVKHGTHILSVTFLNTNQ